MLRNTTRKLSDELINTLEPQAKTVMIRDSSLNRFGLMISKRTRVFVIQAERKAGLGPRRTHVVRLGKFPMVKTDEARAKAVAVLAAIDKGEEPTPPGQIAAGAGTLASGWADYRRSLERKVASGSRSKQTLKAYADLFDRLLVPLHHETLARLSANPITMTRLHARIAETNGTPSADSAARLVRAIYRFASRNDPSLQRDRHPIVGVEFGESRAPDNALSESQLVDWYAELTALGNPIRASFHLFSLLTGLRKGDVLSATWANVDLKNRTLFLPLPKGGRRRSFHLPLSRPALRALWRARAAGRLLHPTHAAVLCFPGHKGQLAGTFGQLSRTGHALRRTFRTQALIAGIPEEVVAVLLNHKSSSQTGAYLNPRAARPFYARAMEQIGAHLVQALIPDPALRRGLC